MKKMFFSTSEVAATQSGAMEAGNHAKHGASSKSLMSRGNFLAAAFFAVLAAGVLFAGCDEKEEDNFIIEKVRQFDGTITANVVNGDEYDGVFQTVKAMIPCDRNYETGELICPENRVVIATTAWSNGGFTMTLPSEPENLKNITELFALKTVDFDDIKYSDSDAKCLHIVFEAYDADDEMLTGFVYVDKDDGLAEFIYVDKEVTVSLFSEGKEFRIVLKAGWNIWGADANMKWYVGNGDDPVVDPSDPD